MNNRQFVLTKHIAKHGKQSIILIPTFLKDRLKPKTLVKITIDIISEAAETKEVENEQN